ncbi:TspO/MBR family protein [Erythrobacter sp.]|uniref:TspO/MBR family protein n=1 Tax=Erythrobacter sp. TaxID=1042 RepID=UPI001B1916B2|nr:TspO/MBR family protein [Erythrobacter sp.]MBO6528077.1 tryptophan-rich sensory protein [Erythrobacter sp.]MBO6528762.1 tryptophan-rich sensory protein [Erythrobacter sp.]
MQFSIVFAISWVLILALGGGLLTKIGSWYRNLEKPSWQPPDWLFGPAWTVILGLAGWAFVLSWDGAASGDERMLLIGLYLANGLFHFLWSPLFFTAKRPDWALLEVPFLWLSVLALCVFLRDWSVLASWLIVPYLAWVSFASILNWKIVRLNGPFPKPVD